MKNKKSRKIITLIIVIAIIGAGAALIKIKKARLSGAPKYGEAPMVVHVASAEQGDISNDLDYLSVVEAFQKANLSSRTSAAVTSVNVDEGSLVKKGDIILEMDSKDINADINALSAQIKQVKADLAANRATVIALEKSAAYWDREAERDTSLARSGAIPEASAEGTVNKADEIKGQRDAAREKSKALEQTVKSFERKKNQLEAQLNYYIIRAPFDGIVTARLVDPGDLASPGRTLIRIEDRSRMMLVFDMPQNDLKQVHEGMPVRFRAGEKIIAGRLDHLYPALSSSRMARAEIYVNGPEKEIFTSGAYVPLTVRVSHIKNAVKVPSACIIKGMNGKPYVYVVKDGHINTRSVKIISENGKHAALKGVKAGEPVVINTFLGWAQLSEGLAVEVLK